MISEIWIALMIGNSRFHWGLFEGKNLIHTWSARYLSMECIENLIQTPHLDNFINTLEQPGLISPLPNISPVPLRVASVVPQQTQQWQHYPEIRIISLSDVPLHNTYPTLGMDRALAVWAGGNRFGFPILVIDGGTALTFTAANEHQALLGGAILPGLGLQLNTLATGTGQLPQIELSPQLTPRWAINTPDAIHSGVIYTLIAGIRDFVTNWLQNFPSGQVVMTGGDGIFLCNYLQQIDPHISSRVARADNLVLEGIALCS